MTERRKKEMKRYMFTLCLLVGFVCSAGAQQTDPNLVGNWETRDGPCSPCVLTIQADGGVKFTLSGNALEVVAAQITPEPGVNVILPQGGKLELALTKSSKYLVGSFTNYTEGTKSHPVAFRYK
jgi:hypothetical protein